jgi:hypothetical protein
LKFIFKPFNLYNNHCLRLTIFSLETILFLFVIIGELVFFEVILKLGDAEFVLDGFILAVFVTLEVDVRVPGADFVSDGLAEFVLLVTEVNVEVFDLIPV